MPSALWVLAGKGLRAHKAHLTLSVLAVVLGVGFIAGTLLLTDSLSAGIAALAPRGAAPPCVPPPTSPTRPVPPCPRTCRRGCARSAGCGRLGARSWAACSSVPSVAA
jgi:hypothetical protein